ncbi:MAG: ankyrin repeat domain-containing protein [Planctomycetota bacterium]|jgi:hypothetical protein
MKHLPLKLGIFVVLLFAVVIAACFLWTPLKVRYYHAKFQSEDTGQCSSGIRGLLASGRAGGEKLVSLLEDELANPSPVRRETVLSALELCKNNGDNESIVSNESVMLLLQRFRFRSEEPETRFQGVGELMKSGSRGLEVLKRNLGGGEKEARFLVENWDYTRVFRTYPTIANSWFPASAICEAIENGYKDTVSLFIDGGFDVNTDGKLGMTLLHIAAGDGQKEIAELLIERGADVNAMYPAGYPIHFAVYGNRRDIVELLIEKGADVNARSIFSGRSIPTALDEAQEGNQSDIASLLRAHGAKTWKELRMEREQ